MKTPINLGIVGCGAVTAQCHAPAILALSKKNILRVSICIDKNLEQAKKIASKLNCGKVDTELSNVAPGSVDALLIATPPNTHFQLILEGAKVAKTLFIEKPFLNTGKEFLQVKKAAQENDTLILVGHMRRLYPSLNMAKDFLQSGILGKVKKAQVFDGNLFRWDTASDYLLGSAGGVVLDTGSHALDSMLYILQLDTIPHDRLQYTSFISNVDSEKNEAGAWGEFIISANNTTLEVSYGFDRILPLANVIRIFCEHGTVEVKTLFSNHFTVIQNEQRYNIFSSQHQYPASVDECFEKQLQDLGNSYSPQHFSRFYHTTCLLEAIGDSKQIQLPCWRDQYV